MSSGEMQPRRKENIERMPNNELQAILLQIFIMINEGVQNVQENNIPHSEFYKFMEIF